MTGVYKGGISRGEEPSRLTAKAFFRAVKREIENRTFFHSRKPELCKDGGVG